MATAMPKPAAPSIAGLKRNPTPPGDRAERFAEHGQSRELLRRIAEKGLFDSLSIDEMMTALTSAAAKKKAAQVKPPRGQGRRGERGIQVHSQLRERIAAAERTQAHAENRAQSIAGFIREAVTAYIAAATKTLPSDDELARLAGPPSEVDEAAPAWLAAAIKDTTTNFDTYLETARAYAAELSATGGRDASMSVTLPPALDTAVKDFLAGDHAKKIGIKSAAALIREAIAIAAHRVEEKY